MGKPHSILFSGLIVAVLLNTGCSDDYLDMTTSFQTDLCLVQQPVRGGSLQLLSDPGAWLIPSAELDTELYKPGERFLVTYIPMDSTGALPGKFMAVNGRPVKVVDMQPVLVKSILERNDTLVPVGPEPVKLTTDPWLGGGFLNLEFLLRFADENIKHGVWLVADSMVSKSDAIVAYFTFLHNANGDGSTRTVTSLVSFTLMSLPGIDRADSLVVSVLEWGGSGNSVKQYRLPNRVNKAAS
ncbi:MAG TPA: hypothetical protein DD409_10805 [Bacteroidales bacterium]|jgi:hypothetical protein|nr:hypothetical protein [Bacteroidales bacterium]